MEKENGVPAPNYTQTPNALFALLPVMHEAELKVTLAIARKTFGWHKEHDMLSLTQLEKMTGLSRQGVIDGIEQGMKRGILERIPSGNSFAYSIIVNDVDQSEDSQPSRPKMVKHVDQQQPEIVNVVDTQKKEFKEKKEVAQKARPTSDKTKNLSHSENTTKRPDSPQVIQRKREILDACGAGVLRPEVADPRKAEQAFVKEFSPLMARIFRREKPIGEDRGATRDIYQFHCDPVWLAERLTAYANGQGEQYRRPTKDGKIPCSYWVRNDIEKEWSVVSQERRDAEQRQAEQADYERRVAAALASVSPSEQEGGRSHPDSVHLHDPVGGPVGNVVCDAAGQAGIAVATSGNVRVRGNGLGVLPMPQPPVGAEDGPGETPERSRSLREMYRNRKVRGQMATVDARVSEQKRSAA